MLHRRNVILLYVRDGNYYRRPAVYPPASIWRSPYGAEIAGIEITP